MISISEKSALLEIYTKPFEKKLRNQWLHVQWSSSSVELHWQLKPFPASSVQVEKENPYQYTYIRDALRDLIPFER